MAIRVEICSIYKNEPCKNASRRLKGSINIFEEFSSKNMNNFPGLQS